MIIIIKVSGPAVALTVAHSAHVAVALAPLQLAWADNVS